MRLAILGLCWISSFAAVARAEDMTVLPLVPPAALLVGGAGDRQAATVEKFGQVSIEEVSLARKIAAADFSIAAVKQHAQYFKFYLVPIKFGVIGFDGKTCKWMQFGATLRVPGADAGQAFTPERIPGHQFEEGFYRSGCQADRFQPNTRSQPRRMSPISGKLGIAGSPDVKWSWSPLNQQVKPSSTIRRE